MITLTKRIPARTKTANFLWCREFMLYGKYSRARKKMGMTHVTHCYWCQRRFLDDDMMAMAAEKNSGNRLLCQECVGKMEQGKGRGNDGD